MNKIIISMLILIFIGCGGSSKSDTVADDNIKENDVALDYIPKKLSDKIAVRFLNKATFGATPADVKHLQDIGVRAWLEEQFNLKNTKDKYLIKMIEIAKKYKPNENNYSIKEYLEDNDIVFNKNVGSFDSPRYRLSAWFDIVINSKTQLREKVAYALSQIIVESDAAGIFVRRAEALANYFDILSDNAFNNYSEILRKISLSPGMGVFLTYNGNKAAYKKGNVLILPDENYARELMQLFSLGVNLLNIDGTPKKDKNGNFIPVYTQNDINELSRVFTGWDLKRNSRFGRVVPRDGDFYHPMESTEKYHDFGEKHLLGKTIPSNLSPLEDINYAINIICSHNNIAPYISKKLIMRLTKSNPSKEYVRRVATVFKESGGNLKEVIKAIFLDKEFWDDLKNDKWEKFKEPLIAYTQFLRAFKADKLKFFHCNKENECHSLTSYWVNDTRWYLNQGPGLARTVFGFYEDDYVPTDEYFEKYHLVAPEIQIQTDIQIINFNNNLDNILYFEKNHLLSKTYKVNGTKVKFSSINDLVDSAKDIGGRIKAVLYYKGADKMLLDLSDEYNVLEREIDGDENGDFENLKDCGSYSNIEAIYKLIEYEDKKLLGGKLSKEEKDVIAKYLNKCLYNKNSGMSKKEYLFNNILNPLIKTIVTSEKYMRE
jgi:uncharacterized protein (DUF1800 family)